MVMSEIIRMAFLLSLFPEATYPTLSGLLISTMSRRSGVAKLIKNESESSRGNGKVRSYVAYNWKGPNVSRISLFSTIEPTSHKNSFISTNFHFSIKNDTFIQLIVPGTA